MTNPAPHDDRVRIKVLIVDDNQLARLGIAALVQTAPDMELVGAARDGAEALALAGQTAPDVVVCDLKMPNVDGVALIRTLASQQPPRRAIALTQLEGDEDVYRALEAGALGYVSKDAAGDEVLGAIRAAAAGQRFLPGSIAAKLVDRMTGQALSLRELQVLKLLAGGLSNRAIAAEIKVAERTVASHVASILEKLGAKNRAEATSIALKRGMI